MKLPNTKEIGIKNIEPNCKNPAKMSLLSTDLEFSY